MAIYIESADLMVYHVPKCGGTWVRAALQAWGVPAKQIEVQGVSTQHSAPIHYPWHTGPRIVVVREPVSWYSSWYRYQCSKAWAVWEANRWHPCRAVEANVGHRGFVDWVTGLAGRPPGPLTKIYEAYLGPMTPVPRMDHGIIPFEDLDRSLRLALELLGIDCVWSHVPPVNVSPPADLPTESVRPHVHLVESAIYEQFGAFWEE